MELLELRNKKGFLLWQPFLTVSLMYSRASQEEGKRSPSSDRAVGTSLGDSLDCVHWHERTQHTNGSTVPWVWPPNCVRGKNEDWAVRTWAVISLCPWSWLSRDQLLYFLPPELPAMTEGNWNCELKTTCSLQLRFVRVLDRSNWKESKQLSLGGLVTEDSAQTTNGLSPPTIIPVRSHSPLSLVPSPPTSQDPAHSPVPQAPTGVRLPGERLHAPLLNLNHQLLRPHMGLAPQELWPKQNSHHHSRLLKCSLEPQVRGHTMVDDGKPSPSLSDHAEHLLIRSKAIPFPLQV